MQHYQTASRHILGAVGCTVAMLLNGPCGGTQYVVPPTGGFYLWVNADLPALKTHFTSAEQMAEQLLMDTGVATLPGDAYGWDSSNLRQIKSKQCVIPWFQ